MCKWTMNVFRSSSFDNLDMSLTFVNISVWFGGSENSIFPTVLRYLSLMSAKLTWGSKYDPEKASQFDVGSPGLDLHPKPYGMQNSVVQNLIASTNFSNSFR
mmetsp:Transcript_40260/g.46182  ORF Transcript_40260/g.46182 Transcript_40260/m.46182 type:complete len:102 (-) Transcript_40260:544-849(-)